MQIVEKFIKKVCAFSHLRAVVDVYWQKEMFHCLLTYVYLTFHFQCKPELKVPGLYVVDSIVRQSRHQFGVDKDVFGPRFLKNFTDTFQNLYHCPEDDKVIIF